MEKFFFWRRATAFLLYPYYKGRAMMMAKKLQGFIKASDRVLDIGGGTGLIAEEIQRLTGAKVIIAEIVDYSVGRVELVVFDGKKLPFANDSFAVVLLLDTLHHSHDSLALLQEGVRVAKKQVIVLENVTKKGLDRTKANLRDSIQYFLFGIPPSNHQFEIDDWRNLFAKLPVKVKEKPWKTLLQPIKQVLFLLEKK